MKKIVFLLLIILILCLISLVKAQKQEVKHLAVGTANPGLIKIYTSDNGNFEEIKKIETGYKFVWTVRMGDIFNNGEKYLIAGVSDSFYGKEFGCRVIGYDLERFEEFIIDETDSFRCKDLSIGDADNDGDKDIILVTHGKGLIRMYSWDGEDWLKEDLEENYVAEYDRMNGENHRVPNDELPCNECVVQTAVHIAQIGDVDNDGKNEVVVSISSPLELKNVPEVGFIKVFRKEEGSWKSEIVDRLVDIEARGVFIADIYNKGKNALLVGTGTPRENPAGLYVYEFDKGDWKKQEVYSNGVEKNMKAMVVSDVYGDGTQRIIFSTGFPDARTFIAVWKDEEFEIIEIAKASEELKIKDAAYNSMALVLYGEGENTQIINGGFITFPKEEKGAEASDKGFLTAYSMENGSWTPKIIDESSIWAMDLK